MLTGFNNWRENFGLFFTRFVYFSPSSHSSDVEEMDEDVESDISEEFDADGEETKSSFEQ